MKIFSLFTLNIIKSIQKYYIRRAKFPRISYKLDINKNIWKKNENLHNVKNKFILTSAALIILNSESTTFSNEKNIQIIMQMAEKAIEEGQIQDAETILAVALKLAETHKMEATICKIYDILINISYTIGDFINAQQLINQIIDRLLLNGIHFNDDLIVTFRLKLARLYGHTANNEQADNLFKECIKIQKTKIDETDITNSSNLLYIDILFWYGVFLFQNDKFTEALDQIQSAYECSLKFKSLNPSQEMVVLTILTEIFCALGDYDNAVTKLKDAIDIGKSIKHPELPLNYVLLGNIYLKKELFEEAKKWCEEGSKLAIEAHNVRAQRASNNCLEKIKQAFDTKYEQNQEHA